MYELRAQIITFDYASKSYTPDLESVSQNSSISYRIININTFTKKVLVNGTLFSLNTDMPTEFSTLFRIKMDNVDDKLKDAQQQVDKMVEVADEAKKNAKSADAIITPNVAKKESKALIATAAQEADNLVVKCQNFYSEAEKIKDALAFQKKLTETITDEHFDNETSMKKALDVRGINPGTIEALKATLGNFKDAYRKVYWQYGVTANAASDVDADGHEAKIKNAQEQIQNDYEALLKQYEETLASIDDLFLKAVTSANYIFTSENPVFVEEGTDEMEFKIQVGNIKDDFSKINPFKKIIKVEGGMKIDYSVGLAFKSISDNQYFFDADNKLQKANSTKTLTPGIAPMMHLYKRTRNNVGWGGMFGINADFKQLTDINLGFLAGASVILGRSQKAIISTGISYSQVSRLKESQYKIGDAYVDTKPEDVTERVLKPSWFVSFSLSIAKRTVLKP
ncbi:hypothetical protein CWM47_26820 [Spirosoma pollinicola]|uniref:Uncharacterized protein n=2 Tax=Spirosoma pollinicola TaxID=2057025 RepID=A0A2K8Z5K5_9BACT|nr:hypothetical protein CWM47_26820 [Spirosoma pollinicola]